MCITNEIPGFKPALLANGSEVELAGRTADKSGIVVNGLSRDLGRIHCFDVGRFFV